MIEWHGYHSSLLSFRWWGEWRNFRPYGTCSIAAGDLRAQSLPGAQNPLLYDRQAAPLEMTMRRVAYCH